MKNAGLREDSIIVIKNVNDEYVDRGIYGHGRKELSITGIHKLKGLKSNITSRFGDYTDHEGNIDLKNSFAAKSFEEFLNETIIEYELVEKKRMTMRQYLEVTGRLTRPEDE